MILRTCIEGILDILHGGQDLRDEVLIAWSHDLVTDSDDDDIASGVIGQHVGSDPLTREVRVGSQGWNVAVSGAYDYSDAGVRQRLDYRRVGAVQPHLADGGRLDELRRRRRRREVVRHLPVIDADARLRFWKAIMNQGS